MDLKAFLWFEDVEYFEGAPLAFLETVSEIKNHELSGRDSKDFVFKEIRHC